MTDAIEKTVTVPLTPDEAFDLFTSGMQSWWPMDSHSLSADSADVDKAHVHMEPRAGGQVIETMADGSTAPWARVTRWEPGAHLQLAWHVGRPEEEATVIDVRFQPHDLGTRVDLRHGGFDALGARGETMQANYDSGWDYVLGQCYCGRFAAQPA